MNELKLNINKIKGMIIGNEVQVASLINNKFGIKIDSQENEIVNKSKTQALWLTDNLS